ncbi:MAG: 1-acyl-sn-glycerol-3-phosphate acyltransferase [Peptococcaceae bacterium]|jgi:1-acyl-sn-glycerol-3-phosphate acyltransferase|nr:1-acyl-sn-glycerol-3-phosphate acyltransferase [Peptococcaceae bacterium]
MLYQFVYYFLAPCVIGVFLRLFNRVKLIDFDKIPTRGPVILIANHVSMWDPVYLYCFVRRRAYFMAKSELFDIPVIGWLLRRIRAFPVKRNTVDRGALRRASAILAANGFLVVFPEGTRGKGEELLEFKDGAALLAHRDGVAVVPLGISGTARSFPKSLGGRVRILCGSPMPLAEFQGRKASAASLKEMSEVFRQEVTRLRDEAGRL